LGTSTELVAQPRVRGGAERLVRKQHPRVQHERPGERDTLLLSGGHPGWPALRRSVAVVPLAGLPAARLD